MGMDNVMQTSVVSNIIVDKPDSTLMRRCIYLKELIRMVYPTLP